MMNTRTREVADSLSHVFKVSVITAGLWAGCVTDLTYAGPTGEQVARGDVSFQRLGDSTIIRASDGSIINYNSFNIASNELVQFIQPTDFARVLNRIASSEPTRIDGTLLANGVVYLVNSAGVMFGNGSVVDVAGLYAAAGNISNQDFINGVNLFTDLNGSIINAGSINASAIHMIGQRVVNEGNLSASGNVITMLAGDQVYIQPVGDKVAVRVDGKWLTDQTAPHKGTSTASLTALPGVENSGTISAPAALVILGAGDIYSLAIRNSGSINVLSGDVLLAATDGMIHNSETGILSASVADGTAGTITLLGPSVRNDGSILANAISGEAGTISLASQDSTFLGTGSLLSAAGGSGIAKGGNISAETYNGKTEFYSGAVADVRGGYAGGFAGKIDLIGNSVVYQGDALATAGDGSYGCGIFSISVTGQLIVDDTSYTGSFNDTHIADTIIESALVDEIILRATNSLTIAEELNLSGQDLNLFAGNTIAINKSILGANNLFATADTNDNSFGSLVVSAPIDILGDATFEVVNSTNNQNVIFLNVPNIDIVNGFTVRTGGQQFYNSPVDLCRDTRVIGSDIFFNDVIHATFDTGDSDNAFLIVDGDTTFNGEVGTRMSGSSHAGRVEFLLVNGKTTMNAGKVWTIFQQEYDGATSLLSDTQLRSFANGDIGFTSSLNGAYALDVLTGGLSRFDGPVGNSVALTSLFTDAPGASKMSANVTSSIVHIGDPLSLGGDVTVKANTSSTFAQTIAGFGHDLLVNSPLTNFLGNVSDVDLLFTNAVGTTNIGANLTANKVDIRDAAILLSNSVVTGHDFVNFGKTLNGPFHLVTNSDGFVVFGGNVGGSAALASLTTNVGFPGDVDRNLVFIDGTLVNVVGDITFNPAGRSSPPEVVTIAARNLGGLTIQSASGNILMGPNEKLTSLGDLELAALNSSITLGDLNSLGDMIVMSPSIFIQSRPAGSILDSSGNFDPDEGIDFVSGGGIFFSSIPTVLGSGADPIFASQADGISSTLGGFDNLSASGISAPSFFFGPLVLDLTPTPGGSDLAPALAFGPTRIRDRVLRDPFALRPMERLAIYMRSYRDDELTGKLNGRELANSITPPGTSNPEEHTIPVNRLRRDSVLRALAQFDSMFTLELLDEESGEITVEDQTEHIRAALAGAWKAYVAEAGDEATPSGFKFYLTEHPQHEDALAYLDGLHAVLREIWVMGATKLECRNSCNAVLAPITPEEMEQAQLEEAINIDWLG